ncbi:kelch repeat and BTB domain-containing protein 2-like [Branchiostoma floridae]|uniref:Kelch repeat and BTB domain-containing protein 2-like n=1 Tax=Branchiostoma floridae TaxID=7739 RepID=A0A9J7L8B5_BRAFL|nr:kelch repeat and BTB domain-containing protein 2-like [Branchiostoma floridae]
MCPWIKCGPCLYQAADLLQLDYVRDTCSSYMAMNVERSTCVNLYTFADVFCLDNVRKACLKCIDRNFAEVASSEFNSLSVNQLTEIISHDELDVKEETTVWEAVVRWVQHSREDRLNHLPSVLPHIRFNLLTLDDTAAILEHPLVKEDPGNSEVIRNVVQKGNHDLKPRLGMTTEMAILFDLFKPDDLLFINPQKGKYITCSYKHEALNRVSAMTVTSENNIYVLADKSRELFQYNHAENVWEHAGMSPVSNLAPGDNFIYHRELLFEVERILYCLGVDYRTGSLLVRMRKYNRHTDQWQECSQLELDTATHHSEAVSCSSHLYFLTSSEMYCYDPNKDCWYERTAAMIIPDVYTAVSFGPEIFCTDSNLTHTMMYDTESDHWQRLQGLPNTLNPVLVIEEPGLFVMENELHIWLNCSNYVDDNNEYDNHVIYVYDRSANAWRDLEATLPYGEYLTYGRQCPVARICLPYINVQDNDP